MALYSWFTRTNKKPVIKHVKTNKALVNNAETEKYIEHYTMWPTAKIKPKNEIITPSFSEVPSEPLNSALPISTELAIVKS